MFSRLIHAIKQWATRTGIAYVRVPAVRLEFARPLGHFSMLRDVRVPYLRIPETERKVFRPFQ